MITITIIIVKAHDQPHSQWQIGSWLLQFENKAGPRNQGRLLLNVTFTLCSKVPSPFYKGEPFD